MRNGKSGKRRAESGGRKAESGKRKVRQRATRREWGIRNSEYGNRLEREGHEKCAKERRGESRKICETDPAMPIHSAFRIPGFASPVPFYTFAHLLLECAAKVFAKPRFGESQSTL